MVLGYYDVNYDFEDDEEPIKTYEVSCYNCGSGNLIDVEYNNKIIDAYEYIEITLECNVCGKKFIEAGIELDIYKY